MPSVRKSYVDEQHQDQQHHGSAVGFIDMQALVGKQIHMGGKGTGGAEHAGGHGGNGAGRVDQGRGFAYNAARCQNHAGQDARHGAGQHNGEYGAQLAGPQGKAALAVRIRHCK